MKNLRLLFALFPWSLLLTAGAGLLPDVPSGQPQAVIDLATADGLQAVHGEWRYSDTRIVEVGFRAAGPEGQPTGHPVRTYDYTPHAGTADYDDSGWEVVQPGQLQQRRSSGKLCFNWYRIGLTLPEQVNGFAVQGATVVFDTSVAHLRLRPWRPLDPLASRQTLGDGPPSPPSPQFRLGRRGRPDALPMLPRPTLPHAPGNPRNPPSVNFVTSGPSVAYSVRNVTQQRLFIERKRHHVGIKYG